MTKQKNIYWINAIKALAMLGVYLFHVEQFYGQSLGLINSFIAPWYVNSFFCVSGYLLFRKQLSQPLVNEDFRNYITPSGGGTYLFSNIIYRVIIPSIVFSAIEYIPSSVIQGRPISLTMFLYKTVGGGTYWFTSALVVSELLAVSLLLTRYKNIWFYALCGLVVSGMAIYLQYGLYYYEIWAWHRGLIAFFFVVLGGLYWRYENIITTMFNKYIYLLLALILVAIILLCDNNVIDPNLSILQLKPLGILPIVVSILLLVEVCKHLPESSILSFIGKNTLGLYFMSGALPLLVSHFFIKFIPTVNILVMLIAWLACVLIGCFIVFLINKWFPFLFDIRILCNKNT